MSAKIRQDTHNVLELLKAHGAKIVSISLPSTSYALSSYYVLASAEASSNLARYDGIEYGMALSYFKEFYTDVIRLVCQATSRN